MSSRKIAYVLGAGFSFGSNHAAQVGRHLVRMPLQYTLFEELCRFHYQRIRRLDSLARTIRQYFSPNTYRATRGTGSSRHGDLFRLSIEEVVTFFDEIVTNGRGDVDRIRAAADELQLLTVEIISFLSTHGNPGHNRLVKKFVRRLAQTDVLITFNWDTLLDRALANQKKFRWHPSWGYGGTVRGEFTHATRNPPALPRKYPRLLKLHGSINWVAYQRNAIQERLITANWNPGDHSSDVVMMPPKMIKPEVWGRKSDGAAPISTGGNGCVTEEFYPTLWSEAQRQLSGSRRIVFIGYSFPPADFAVGNMLRRAISYMKVETGKFPDVDIVDPNASLIAERFEQSFKIKVPISNRYLSLESYLYSARAS